MNIGDRIKLIRTNNKLSMASFGEKIEMTDSNISKMEKGQRTVTDRTIKLISLAFNINEDWLRTGNGEMYLDNSEITQNQKRLIIENICIDDKPEVKESIMRFITLNDDQQDIINRMMKQMLKRD